MKRLKEWSFVWILILNGVIFFTATDSWNVMGKPFVEVSEWYQQRLLNSGREPAAALPGVSGGNPDGSDEENIGVSGGELPPDKETAGNEDYIEGTEVQTEEEIAEGGSSQTETQPVSEESSEKPSTDITGIRKPEEVTYKAVEDDYFTDAVFIGDSRTVGMFEYGGLEDITTFYASTGLTVYKLFDSPIVTVPGEKEKKTIEEALTERKFSKIYLMIGINEMGRGTVDTFIEKYAEVLEHLRMLQPNAIIYLQGIMKVTTARSDKGDYINNPGIDERNVRIEELADYVKVYYLDVNPYICDETGGMDPSYTFDGVHLKAQYIPIWKDFLKQNAVVLD